jgi:hypothetical protein
VRQRSQPSFAARLEARVRSGSAAHLLGGTLDLGQALVRAGLHHIRSRRSPTPPSASPRPGGAGPTSGSGPLQPS